MRRVHGDVAQLGEHRVRNAGVVGSNPIISTISIKRVRETGPFRFPLGTRNQRVGGGGFARTGSRHHLHHRLLKGLTFGVGLGLVCGERAAAWQ